jgi:hypothetical protein
MPQRLISQVIEQQEIATVAPTSSVIEAVRTMKQRRIGALMVVEGDRLVGILTERDVVFRVVAEERDVATTQVADVMTANPESIRPDKPFGHALHGHGFRPRRARPGRARIRRGVETARAHSRHPLSRHRVESLSPDSSNARSARGSTGLCNSASAPAAFASASVNPSE